MFDFVFAENGMHNLDTRTGELKVKKIVDYLGKEDHDKLVKWTNEYLESYPCPDKADTFVSVRDCSLNVSPLGTKNWKQFEDRFASLNTDNHIL